MANTYAEWKRELLELDSLIAKIEARVCDAKS